MLSGRARELFPISVECKNRAKFAVYKDYEQAKANNPDSDSYTTVVCIKQNQSEPLVVLDAKHYFRLLHTWSTHG